MSRRDRTSGVSVLPIEAEGLAVGYALGAPLLSGLHLAVHPGEIVTLVGPNGTGKSTVLKTILSQLRPLAGVVRIGGKDASALSAHDRALAVAALLTDRVQTELTTCRDVVEAGRYPHTGMLGILASSDRAAVREAMELVGVWELRDQDFMKVSDGQRQRVLVARALAQGTPTLVLDEPASHLDIGHQIELMALLRRLARERGLAVLMALHELELARQASDWLLAVKDGGLLAEGTSDEVFVPAVIEPLFDLTPGSYDPHTGAIALPGDGGADDHA